MIHSCNWSSCKSKLNPECFSQLSVLQTREETVECVLLSSDSRRVSVPEHCRAVQISPSDSFNVFLFFSHPLPSSRSYLFWPAQSQTSSPRTSSICTHWRSQTHTHSHTHSDVDSFVIYRQYQRDDKDNSVCSPARFQSKQLSMKLIQ